MANNKMVASWFTKAGKDLRLAKASLEFSDDFFEESAFHSQQCAEKSIKGFLTYHKCAFKKIHDIEKLVKKVEPIDAELAEFLKPAESLTRYAIAYRYPDATDIEEMTQAKAIAALEIAEKVFQELKSKVPST